MYFEMNTVYIHSILFLFMATLQLLVSSPNDSQGINSCFTYTPKEGWINDPTQQLYVPPKYVRCYQYNNYSNQNGNISWGQSTSEDLVNWKDTGVVIAYDPVTKQQRFTGTAVFDEKNTSGLGRDGVPPVVAAFTNFFGQDGKFPNSSAVAAGTQSQYLAYTHQPFGQLYQLYDKNPVIAYPPDRSQRENFRDPFLLWYEPHKTWIAAIVLAELRQVLFYASPNLINWRLLSTFSSPATPKYQWECPGLFPVNLINSKDSKWVLLISTNPGAAVKGPGVNPDRSATGSCVHYYVGDFDGVKFTITENKDGRVYYMDEGSDYYATNVFNNIGNRTLVSPWVNNWEYATRRTDFYKGALGFVRQVFLKLINGAYRLIQIPVPELEKYVIQRSSFTRAQITAGIPIEIKGKQAYKFVVTFKGTANFVVALTGPGKGDEVLRIYNYYQNKTICVRKQSVDPSKKGTSVIHCAEYTAGSTTILSVFVTRHSCVLLCDIGWPEFTEVVNKILGKIAFTLIAGSSAFVSGNHFLYDID